MIRRTCAQEIVVDRVGRAGGWTKSPRSIPSSARRALADRLGDGVGLLVDLLEHERLVALLLGGVGVPVDLDDLALERLAVGGLELDALGAQDDDLVVLDVLDARVSRAGRPGSPRR